MGKWLTLGIAVLLLVAACSPAEEKITSEVPLPNPESDDTGGRALVVSWVVDGDLFIWHSSDPDQQHAIASGNVIRPYVAPDASAVVYARGPEGTPRSLWIDSVTGTNARELVSANDLTRAGEARRLNQIVWAADAQAVYFNTLVGEAIDTRPADDLWRVTVADGVVERLLPDGQGGLITLSPDQARLALSSAGTYGATPAAVAFYDLAAGTRFVALEFPAVATGSEWRWQAQPRWLPDSSGVLVAVPPVDLVYGGDGDLATALWRLPVDGPARQIGTVDADFFGLPTFSPDGAWVAYLHRRAAPQDTDLTLMLAASDGSGPVAYAAGPLGALSLPSWLLEGNRFVFTNGAPGMAWLGEPGAAPRRFPSEQVTVADLVWAGPSAYVFSTQVEDTFILNLNLLDVASPLNPIVVTSGYPFFDAVMPRDV